MPIEQTRIYSGLRVTLPCNSRACELMLDDDGQGQLTVIGPRGPEMSIPVSDADDAIAILQEAVVARDMLRASGHELVTG